MACNFIMMWDRPSFCVVCQRCSTLLEHCVGRRQKTVVCPTIAPLLQELRGRQRGSRHACQGDGALEVVYLVDAYADRSVAWALGNQVEFSGAFHGAIHVIARS